MSKKPKITNSLLVILSIFTAIIFAELGYRGLKFVKPLLSSKGVNPHVPPRFFQPSEIPGLEYDIKPNLNYSSTQKGWEGIEIRTDKSGGRIGTRNYPRKVDLKIALLGDSSSFGWRVNYEESYGHHIETMLEQSSQMTVQLKNFCVPGYNTTQHLLALKHKVLPWNPDIIILHHDLNDSNEIIKRGHNADTADTLFHSKLLYTVKNKIDHIAQKGKKDSDFLVINMKPSNPRKKSMTHYRYKGPQYERMFDELQRIKELSHEIPVMLFAFFAYPTYHERVEEDPVNKLLITPLVNRATEMGYATADGYLLFQHIMKAEGLIDMSSYWIDETDGHPNPTSHKSIAAALVKEIREKLIPKVNPPRTSHLDSESNSATQ